MEKLKIISGGQTGADLAGLWAAKIFSLPTGGMAPKGWKTMDGAKPELSTLFGLEESNSGYHGRTLQNCESSECTLIFASNIRSPGTKLTIHHCIQSKIHYEVFAFGDGDMCKMVENIQARLLQSLKFQISAGTSVINVAGNSSSTSPRAFTFTFLSLCKAFESIFGTPEILQTYDVKRIESLLRDSYDEPSFDVSNNIVLSGN